MRCNCQNALELERFLIAIKLYPGRYKIVTIVSPPLLFSTNQETLTVTVSQQA
jgi:hypothetical protein